MSRRLGKEGLLTAVALGLALLVQPRAALAQELDASREGVTRFEAKQRSNAGLAAFGQGRYQQAIEHFRAAYELVPAPLLLYNIAQAERLSGHCKAAIGSYQRFLETEPPKGRELAEAHLRELGSCPELSQDSSPEPLATVPVAATTPKAADTAVRVTRVPPRPASTLLPPPSRTHADARASRPKVLHGALSFGSAGLFFALSGYLAWRADRASDETSQLFARGGSWDQAAAATERDGRLSSILALVAAGGGLATTGVGVWVLAFD